MADRRKCPTCGEEIGEYIYDPCDGTMLRCEKCKDGPGKPYTLAIPSSMKYKPKPLTRLKNYERVLEKIAENSCTENCAIIF